MTGRERALNRQPALLRQFLQRHLRPRADVLDHFGGRERAELAALLVRQIAREAVQEAGREEIAGAGRVDQLLDRRGRRRDAPSVGVTTTQPFSLRVTTPSLTSLRSA